MFGVIKGSQFIKIGVKNFPRYFSGSSSLGTKQWRLARGLPAQRNAEGVLTDAPDYTFLDGRPTPLLHKQKLRLLKQQEFAKKIVELNSELDFAIEREKSITKAKEQERQRVIGDRLKPKGFKLLKKSS